VNGVAALITPIIKPTWDDLQMQLNTYFGQSYTASWAFRGVGKEEWGLQSSLERLGVDPSLIVKTEQYLLDTFQRQVHHYISDPPHKDDYLEWLALMQHYRAPTRLLDMTKSPYVALFFAIEKRREDGGNCALWAIDLQWCKEQARQQILSNKPNLKIPPDESLGKPETFSKVFFDNDDSQQPIKFVAPLQPFRMNERLTIQQGLFLCPGDLRMSFEDNLLAFPQSDFPKYMHKILIPNILREDILIMLNKMNINRASLFPGIEGFAESLIANVQIATRWGKLSSEQQRLNILSEFANL
jgi:hypothetical protein